jgi:MFS family permease
MLTENKEEGDAPPSGAAPQQAIPLQTKTSIVFKNADLEKIPSAAPIVLVGQPPNKKCWRITSPKLRAEPDSARAWSVALGAFLGSFAAMGQIYATGIFIEPYLTEFGSDLTSTSLVSTMSLAMFYVGGLFATHTADYYGTRTTTAFGSVIWILGCMLGSLATQIWHSILCQGVLCGLGAAGISWPMFSIMPQWFKKYRATGMGIAALGSGVGSIAFSLGGEQLITQVGWRNTLRIIGGIGGGLLIFAVALVDRRVAITRSPQGVFRAIYVAIRELIGMSSARWFLLCTLLFQFSFFVPYVFISSYSVSLGLSQWFGGFSVAFLGIGSAVGRLICGPIADYFGRLAVFRVTVLAAGIAMACWPACTNESTILAFAFFYGAFAGSFFAMFGAVAADVWGVERLSAMFTLINLVCIPGAFASGPVIGAIVDTTGSYTDGVETAAALMLASFISVCLIRRPTLSTTSPTMNAHYASPQSLPLMQNKQRTSTPILSDSPDVEARMKELEQFDVHAEDFKLISSKEDQESYIRMLQRLGSIQDKSSEHFSMVLTCLKQGKSFDQCKMMVVEKYGKIPNEWEYESIV